MPLLYPGSNSGLGHSKRRLHVLSVSAWVLSGYFISCVVLAVCLCVPCDELATCTGCTPPLAQCLGSAPAVGNVNIYHTLWQMSFTIHIVTIPMTVCRYAKHYIENGTEKRTLLKVFGIRFDIIVQSLVSNIILFIGISDLRNRPRKLYITGSLSFTG